MTQLLARRAIPVPYTSAAPPIEFPRLAASRSRSLKRSMDIVAAATLLLASLPIAILIAILTKLESGGPVFFAHRRIGKGNRRFRIWKFRTMVVDGDEVLAKYFAENPGHELEWQLNHKLRDDPRVTRVGRWLRRTSLDELPQVWNVLRGEMSMVGPRPIVDDEVLKYGSAFSLYTLATPGLTGLWQVSGRNDTSYRRRVALDSAYVRHWTPLLDVMLLFKTVRVVVRGKGAY